ncbi:hypothetical protein IJT93_13440 [bacterium]|nr:hypothetical protein [bacterium]
MKYYKISLENKLKEALPAEDLFADNRCGSKCSCVRLIPRNLRKLNGGWELTLKSPFVKLAAAAAVGVTALSGAAPAQANEGLVLNSIDSVRIYETCFQPQAAGAIVSDITLGAVKVEGRTEEECRFIAGQHSNSYQHTNSAPTSHSNAGWANHSNQGGSHSNSDWTNHCNTNIDGTSHVNMMHGDFLF